MSLSLDGHEIDRLPNHQVATLVLYELGGDVVRQDSEDVAARCFALAPRRFCWKKYPKYPSLDTARVALSDAKKAEKGRLVSGGIKEKWILTPSGVTWCKDHLQGVGSAVLSGTSRLTDQQVQAIKRLRRHRLFQDWKSGADPPSQELVAETMRLLPDAPVGVLRRRLEDLLSAARSAELDDAEGFLQWLMETLSTAS